MVDLGQKGVRNHERLFYFIAIKKPDCKGNQA
ncbi:MAG: hypothetical protein RL607_2483 [Bacteroidota bacterium]